MMEVDQLHTHCVEFYELEAQRMSIELLVDDYIQLIKKAGLRDDEPAMELAFRKVLRSKNKEIFELYGGLLTKLQNNPKNESLAQKILFIEYFVLSSNGLADKPNINQTPIFDTSKIGDEVYELLWEYIKGEMEKNLPAWSILDLEEVNYRNELNTEINENGLKGLEGEALTRKVCTELLKGYHCEESLRKIHWNQFYFGFLRYLVQNSPKRAG